MFKHVEISAALCYHTSNNRNGGDTILAMEFHEKLQALRKNAGLTQEDLASRLFVSRTAISKWESGRGYPSIDSLKAIANFFSISIDELLSSDQILTLADEQQQCTLRHFCDYLYAFSDLCMALLLFLPLFAERTDQSLSAVSLLQLSAIRPWIRILYLLAIILSVAIGILTLALQNCPAPFWLKSKTRISLALGILSVSLFVMGLHPYAAIFAFALLSIKLLFPFKQR